MSFPPATPMSFARILTPRPGYTYDRVTYPNLPQFAETITFDRYNDDQTLCGPFAQCSPEYAQYCDRLRTSRLGGLGMLTVPVAGFVRAAANGLGGLMGLGETYEERAARERARIAHETAMRNAAAATPSGPRAPLPPGTTKTPMQAAADAVGNFFGAGSGTPATPPGTTTDEGEDLTTSATPPINTSGAPNWGLYVGLAVLAIGGVVLAVTLTKKSASGGAVANRRRSRRRRNAAYTPVKRLRSVRAIARQMTDSDVKALRDEASVAGDLEMVNVCNRALRGSKAARRECAFVILNAQEDY